MFYVVYIHVAVTFISSHSSDEVLKCKFVNKLVMHKDSLWAKVWFL